MKALRILAIALVVAMAFAACRGGLRRSMWAPPQWEAVEGAINVADGTHRGVGDGYYGEMTVDVTVVGRSIVAIEVVEHVDTPAFANSVFEFLIPQILARQTTSVDAAAGATHTVHGFIGAIEDALVSAGASLSDIRQGDGGAYTGGHEAAASTPATPAAIPYTPGRFTPGTFVASGDGYHVAHYDGVPVTVEVVFDDGSIVSITVIDNEETPMFFGFAYPSIAEAMVAAGTYDVAAVAGATYSSNAIRDAVRLAIEQASN